MTHRVVFTPSAKQDLLAAREWYDAHELDLGKALLSDVLAATNRMGSNPEQFAKVYGEVRQLVLKRFPYVISFRVNNDQVELLSILHGHRNPDIWKRRSR